MNWHIGQPVIYLGSTRNGYVKDKEMVVTGIKKTCHSLVINADSLLIPGGFVSVCSVCNNTTGREGELLYLKEALFAPLMDISELKEILNEETFNK